MNFSPPLVSSIGQAADIKSHYERLLIDDLLHLDILQVHFHNDVSSPGTPAVPHGTKKVASDRNRAFREAIIGSHPRATSRSKALEEVLRYQEHARRSLHVLAAEAKALRALVVGAGTRIKKGTANACARHY